MFDNVIARTKVIRDVNGEWVVLAYNKDGKRIPEADYFASDKKDAEETSKLMTKGK